jgi:hypothetical protein
MAIRYRYDLYPRTDPRDGTRLVRFTKLQQATYRDVVGVGSGALTIRSTEAEAEFLDPAGEQYVRVVREDTSDASELVVGGWWINKYSHKTADKTLSKRLVASGAGAMAYLGRARMAPHTYIHDVFTGQDPFDDKWRLYAQGDPAGGDYLGAVLWRVIYEAQHFRSGATYTHKHKDGLIYTDSHDDDRTQTVIPDLVMDFDQFEDSNGNAWSVESGEFTAQVGESVLSVVQRLMNAGLYVRMNPDTFVLQAYENDEHRRDRTGGAWGTNVVRFQAPTDGTVDTGNILSESERLLESSIKRSLIWAGGQDHYEKATQASDVPWEGFEASDVVSSAALSQIAGRQLSARNEAADTPKIRLKMGRSPATGRYLPWEQVRVEDLVTVNTGTEEWDFDESTYPVAALRIELQRSGAWHGWAELGDGFGSAQSKVFQTTPAPAHVHTLPWCQPGVPATTTATRYYFTTSTAGGPPGVTEDAAWDRANGDNGMAWKRGILSPTPLSTVSSTSSWGVGTLTPPDNSAHGQHFLELSGAGTFSGSVRAVLQAKRRTGVGVTSSQRHQAQMVIRIVSADGSVVRGTLLEDYSPGVLDSATLTSSYVTKKFPASASWADDGGAVLTPVAYLDGDWLVVETGVHTVVDGSGTGASVRYNDSAASDLPLDESSTDVLCSWIEFVTVSDGGSTGDLPLPTVHTGEASVGTAPRIARCDHEHEHGLLSPDGSHYHDAAQVQDLPEVPATLDDLTDVDTSTSPPADGDALVWDDGAGLWVPGTAGGSGSLTVEEEDGTPSESPVSKIEVPNGSLTVDSSGVVSLDYAVSGHTHGGGGVAVPDLLSSLKASADTPDDEFPGTSLDAKWTVVDGSAGAVSLLAGSGAGVYEVGERAGWLHMQVGTASGDSVRLRQDYTLPDGQCMVLPMGFAFDVAAASLANNEIQAGLCLNDNDTGPFSGAAGQTAALMWDTEASGYRIIGWDGSSVIGNQVATVVFRTAYFRISRTGLAYDIFLSMDGFDWSYLGRKTMGSAANNVWIFADCAATMSNRVVIGTPWIRQGSALTIDPWPIT